jgi:4-hydroxy-3-methylbut-2-en-1-yl diphosphate synthase IspG/GcpE
MDSKFAAYAEEEIRRTKTIEMPLHIAVTGCMVED